MERMFAYRDRQRISSCRHHRRGGGHDRHHRRRLHPPSDVHVDDDDDDGPGKCPSPDAVAASAAAETKTTMMTTMMTTTMVETVVAAATDGVHACRAKAPQPRLEVEGTAATMASSSSTEPHDYHRHYEEKKDDDDDDDRGTFIVGSSSPSSSTSTTTMMIRIPPTVSAYLHAFAPPYRGMMTTVLGMTWARAAIFWGSDYGRDWMRTHPRFVGGSSEVASTVVPPLVVSTLVQIMNQPIVRATITLQDPSTEMRTAWEEIGRAHV